MFTWMRMTEIDETDVTDETYETDDVWNDG